MNRLLQPVAFGILLVLGTVPAGALACELACAARAVHHHDSSDHHDASGHATPPGESSTPAFAAASAEAACIHLGDPTPVVKSVNLKAFAPVAGPVGRVEPAAAATTDVVAPPGSAHSPPGTRSAPLPLRI